MSRFVNENPEATPEEFDKLMIGLVLASQFFFRIDRDKKQQIGLIHRVHFTPDNQNLDELPNESFIELGDKALNSRNTLSVTSMSPHIPVMLVGIISNTNIDNTDDNIDSLTYRK